MKKLTPSERRMVMICAIVVVVGAVVLMSPPATTGKKLLTAAQAVTKREDLDRKIKLLRKETDELKPHIDALTYTEAPEVVVPKVIRTLQKCAVDSGIHIREVKPLRAKKFIGVIKVPLNVRFTCEFGKSVPFLYRVEAPENKIVVDKFTVTASDPKKHTVDVDVEVDLFTQGNGAASEGSGG